MEITAADSDAPPEQSWRRGAREWRRGGRGRRRIEIKKIQDRRSLILAFSKRRTGLFKKAGEVCNLCGVEAAVITFSPAGKPYAFGKPSADSVVRRYLTESISTASTSELYLPAEDEEEEEEEEVEDVFWWQQSIEDLDKKELVQYKASLEGLRRNLIMRIEEMKMRRAATRNFFE